MHFRRTTCATLVISTLMITGCGSSSDSSNEPDQLAALPDLHNEGVVGEKGDTGPTGPAGPQGIQGIQGVAGSEGQDGVDGIQGEAGSDGAYLATQPIIDHLQKLTGIDTFLEIVSRLGIVDYLSDGDQRLTLFVPTDKAFNALSRAQLEDLLADDDRLSSLVYTHLLHEERVTPSSVLHPSGEYSDNGLNSLTFELDPDNPDQLVLDMTNFQIPDITPEDSLFTQAAAVYLVDDFLVDNYFFAPDTGSLMSKLGRLPQYRVFTNALRQSGLADEMKDSDQVFSVYAVNNDYFSTIGGIDVEVERYGSLRAFLENHITERTVNDTSVETTQYLESLSGQQLQVTQTDDVLRVNGIRVIDDEKVQASNGTIYGLDYAIHETDNAGQPVGALSVLDVLNLASERYAAQVANGEYSTNGGYAVDPGYYYNSYYNKSFSGDYNPYEFFKELIVAAQMENLFESPANEWTLLVPINGFMPEELYRKYLEATQGDDYNEFRSIFNPSKGGVTRDLGTYIKSAELQNASYSLVPDLIPDSLAAQKILFAHMIRGTYRSDELKLLSGSNISTIDGAENLIETVGNLPSIKGTSFVGVQQVAVNGYVHVIKDFLELPHAFIDSFPASPYQLHSSPVVRAIAEHGDHDKYLNTTFRYGDYYLMNSNFMLFVSRDSDIEGELMSETDWFNSMFSNSGELVEGAVISSFQEHQYTVGKLGDVPTVNGLKATLIYDGDSGARVYSIPGVLD